MTTYYAAAKKKTQGHNAGSIFKVWRDGDAVCAQKQNFTNHPVTLKVMAVGVGDIIAYSVEMARRTFTRPCTDIEAVIEESIMICEATYC